MKGVPGAPDAPASRQELDEILRDMRTVNERLYWTMFHFGFGHRCHAFLEFCGLMSKYADLCRVAAAAGVDFRFTNTHSGAALPMETHHVEYLAEKLACIYGPFFEQHPELVDLLADKLKGSR